MSSADDLREAIAIALYYGENDADKRTWQQAEEVADYYRIAADNALAVLSSHPEAVLSLLGTVRKGHEVRWSDGAAYGENYVQFHDVPDELREYVSPVFVVSLAETTKDAS